MCIMDLDLFSNTKDISNIHVKVVKCLANKVRCCARVKILFLDFSGTWLANSSQILEARVFKEKQCRHGKELLLRDFHFNTTTNGNVELRHHQ